MKSFYETTLLYAALLGILLLGVFVGCSALGSSLYQDPLTYIITLMAGVLVVILLYYRALRPMLSEGQGTAAWFLKRGLLVGVGGVLAATVFVHLYAYYVDDYFPRRMRYQEQQIDHWSPPPQIKRELLRDAQDYETYHYEELVLLLCGGVAVLLGSGGLTPFFMRYDKRAART
ncbi:hypothetical protein FY528_20100 [Hymenobacter lutimineralis]|uniref:DUF4199 domain-containing protein n=1 Tax=Hymenobacter lutimineralis TaxID=2606448 RepID=A0A5D6US97_9BACT|nr:hypothetical protein [Hymenobacter lutimineralis]TYZ05925.1 hypothetical protein FY528_20100 [Hymenobacter lutimineralis]